MKYNILQDYNVHFFKKGSKGIHCAVMRNDKVLPQQIWASSLTLTSNTIQFIWQHAQLNSSSFWNTRQWNSINFTPMSIHFINSNFLGGILHEITSLLDDDMILLRHMFICPYITWAREVFTVEYQHFTLPCKFCPPHFQFNSVQINVS